MCSASAKVGDAIEVDARNRIDLRALEARCRQLRAAVKIIALVGIGGTTETGNIDPLKADGRDRARARRAFSCRRGSGGLTLFSARWRHLLAGIELADSVTLDAAA